MQAFIFDFYGVICSEIAPFVLPRYMPDDEAVEYKATVVERADLGEISFSDTLIDLSRRTGAPVETLEAEFWSFVKIDPDMVALIESLKGRYTTALLSNAMYPFLDQILTRHNLKRLFDTMVISCEEHVTKPNPEIYRRVVGRLGVAADACFFTDDNAVNIAAAQAFGLNAVRFTGVADLKRELTARGVL